MWEVTLYLHARLHVFVPIFQDFPESLGLNFEPMLCKLRSFIVDGKGIVSKNVDTWLVTTLKFFIKCLICVSVETFDVYLIRIMYIDM